MSNHILAEFNGYKLTKRRSSPFFVLYDRADGPVIQGDTKGTFFLDALEVIDNYRATAVLGPYTQGDIEAIEKTAHFLHQTSVVIEGVAA